MPIQPLVLFQTFVEDFFFGESGFEDHHRGNVPSPSNNGHVAFRDRDNCVKFEVLQN